VVLSAHDLSVLSSSLLKLQALELEVCKNSNLTREIGETIGTFKSLDTFTLLNRRCGKNPVASDHILEGLIDKRSSKLKSLNIGHSRISDEILQNVVLKCQNLIKFNWMLPGRLSETQVLLLTAMCDLKELTLSLVEKEDIELLSQYLATMHRLRKLMMYSFQIPLSSGCLIHKEQSRDSSNETSSILRQCICNNFRQMRGKVSEKIKIFLHHQSKYCENFKTLEEINYDGIN